MFLKNKSYFLFPVKHLLLNSKYTVVFTATYGSDRESGKSFPKLKYCFEAINIFKTTARNTSTTKQARVAEKKIQYLLLDEMTDGIVQ